MIDDYKDCFNGALKVYWLPSYLAREDPKDLILSPEQLISHLSDPSIAEPAQRDEGLLNIIRNIRKGIWSLLWQVAEAAVWMNG